MEYSRAERLREGQRLQAAPRQTFVKNASDHAETTDWPN